MAFSTDPTRAHATLADQITKKEGGVPQNEMWFSSEPTARGDDIAAYVRKWYEANRETWWRRHKPGIFGYAPDRSGVHADEFMLAFINEVDRVQTLARLP
jgi:hypothetical protein